MTKARLLLISKYLLSATPLLIYIIPTNIVFPFVTGKAIYFRLLITVTYSLFLLTGKKANSTVASRIFFIFGGIILLADIFTSTDPFNSTFGTAERMGGFLELLYLFLYYKLLITIFSKKDIFLLLKIWIITSIGSFFSILGQWLQCTDRGSAFFGNPIFCATVALGTFVFAIYLWHKEKKNVWLFFATINWFILLASATKSIIFGLLGAACVTIALYTLKKGYTKAVLKVLLIVFLLGISVFTFKKPSFCAKTEDQTIGNRVEQYQISKDNRYTSWKIAGTYIQKRPFLGYGQESFKSIFYKEYSKDRIKYGIEAFDRVHNAYLDWTINGGILAGILYFILYVYAYITAFKRKEHILAVLILALGIHSIFMFDTLLSWIMLLTGLALIEAGQLSTLSTEKNIKSDTVK